MLGEAARDDEEITRRLGILMEEANGRPSEPPENSESYRTFQARLETYVRSGTGEPGTSQGLVGLFGQAPSDAETRVTGQIAHWLFALGDTLAVNTFRALALLATHPQQRERAEQEVAESARPWLEGCLLEAMRLWPTTPILSRITVEEVSWNEGDPGWRIPAGTQVLIVNTFHHRDRRRFDFADRLAPEIWSRDTGAAVEDPATRYSFNFFSHGPQGCPGRELALLVGTTVLATWLEHRPHPPRLIHPRLDPDRPLPSMLDPYRLRYSLQEDPP